MSYSIPVFPQQQTSREFTIHELNSDNLGLIIDLLKEENAKLQRQADDYQVVLNYMNSSERQHFLNVVKLHRYGIELEKLLAPTYHELKGQVATLSTHRTDVRPLYFFVCKLESTLKIPHRFILTITDKIYRLQDLEDIQ